MKPIGKIILPAVVATAATPGHAARAIAGSLALLVAFLWGNSMQSAAQTLPVVPDNFLDEQIRQVFVRNADGTNQKSLTSLPGENGHAGWGVGG
jgi:hypothetical protein